VIFKSLTLEEFNRRASDGLGMRIAIEPAFRYKLCDFKPTYGVVFSDDLGPFDYWGCSDMDVIWGDIRSFVTDAVLQEHDIVTSRVRKLAGHFTLFRNTPSINRTYELIPDVAREMTQPEYLRLDERTLTEQLRAHAGDGSGTAPASPRVYWQRELTMSAAYQRALGNTDADSLWWRNGRTFAADGSELMYLHFHKLKKRMQTIDFGFDEAPDAFRINRQGVFAHAGAVTAGS